MATNSLFIDPNDLLKGKRPLFMNEEDEGPTLYEVRIFKVLTVRYQREALSEQMAWNLRSGRVDEARRIAHQMTVLKDIYEEVPSAK